jgi:hypothetical protein
MARKLKTYQTLLPSGENATPHTPLLCTVSCRSSCLDSASQSRAVLSKLPVKTVRPSGENATASTPLPCPVNWRNSCPEATSHSRALDGPTIWRKGDSKHALGVPGELAQLLR